MKIGLTGNIGSGKTTVSRLFELLGIPVYYADIQAKIFLDDADVIARVNALFGSKVLDKDHKIDRSKLAALVFKDNSRLQLLNGIIHPLVRAEYKRWHHAHEGSPYTIQEAAILFETGHYKDFDRTIVVSAPESMRIARVCKRDKTDEESVRQRMKHQMDQKQLEDMADFVIINDELQPLIPQVLEVHRLIGKG
jgi:dephospho-CoA kinase